MVVMTIISFSTFVDLLSGSYGDYVPLFLPGIFIGIVFGFGSFGIATLRFGTYTTTVGALFLLLVCTFLFNVGTGIAGVLPHLGKVIGIVTVLTVTNLALGHLRGRGGPNHRLPTRACLIRLLNRARGPLWWCWTVHGPGSLLHG